MIAELEELTESEDDAVLEDETPAVEMSGIPSVSPEVKCNESEYVTFTSVIRL